MRRLFLNSSVLTAGAIAAQLLTTVAFWMAARLLAPREFGPIVGLVGLATLALSVADFGINAASVRALARAPEDRHAFEQTLTGKAGMAVALGAAWVTASLAAGATGVAAPGDAMASVVLGLYLATAVFSTTLSVPFIASQRMGIIAAGNVVTGVAIVATMAPLLAFANAGPVAVSASQLAGAIAAVAFYVLMIDRDLLHVHRPSLRELRSLWRESIGFGLSSLSVQLQRADVSIVALVAGADASGVFAVPARLTNPLGIVPTAFSSALYPRIAASGHSRAARREALLGGALVLGLMGVALAILFALADALVPFLLGSAYAGAVPVVRVYLVAMLLASTTQPMAVYLQAIHHELYVARAVMAAAVAGLAGVALGAYLGGAMGAAFGFGVQQLVVVVVLAFRLFRLPVAPVQPAPTEASVANP